jgi:cytochrome c
MKSTVIAVAVTLGAFAPVAANAQEALAKSSGCLTCHALDTKKVGPAFKDVAAKYKGKDNTETMLNAKVGAAKGHPKVKASEEDVNKLVKWILAM